MRLEKSACFVGMVGMMCVACERARDVEVHVSALDARGQEIECGKAVALTSDVSMRLEKLRFYVHDVAFRREDDGAWIVPEQPGDRAHVGEGVWLVDLDDEACDAKYSPEAHRTLPMRLPRARYDAMRFTLGVPERLNHQDPLSASPHLALTSMHWGWQAGYRFFRLDGKIEGTSYAVHLGSTACTGEVGEAISCERPNRARFLIEHGWFSRGDKESLRLDVAAMLEGVAWDEAKGCMGNAGEGDCDVILSRIGIVPETGLPGHDPDATSVFTARGESK